MELNLTMKKIILAIALVFAPSLAWAQCAGVFPAHTVCGNTSASANVPTAVPFGGTIIGPGSSVVGQFATWGDTAGSVLADFDLFGSNNTWTGTDTWSSTATFNGTLAGTAFGSPPAIGGTAPAAGKFTTLQATGNLTTNVTGKTQCLHVNSSGVVSGSGFDCTSRNSLTVPTTFYVATTGNCTTGDGTVGNPWATPICAYQHIQQNYDLDGQAVTIQIADGTYTSTNQIVGKIVGEAGPVIFQGNCGTPANVLIKPATGGSADSAYAFSAQGQSIIQLQCMKLDETNNTDPLLGSDTIAIEYQSTIILGQGIIFGNNLNQWNDATVAGTLTINSNYTIAKDTVTTTGSWTSGSNTVTVVSATGILKYMGVTGANVPDGAYVSNIVGTTVTLGYVAYAPVTATTGAGSGTTLLFSYGGQCHIDVGTLGRVLYSTNGDPLHAITVTPTGTPFYLVSYLFGSQLSVLYDQAVSIAGGYPTVVNAVPFFLRTNSVLDTGLQGSYYIPGIVGQAGATGGTTTAANSTVAVTSSSLLKVGNAITAYESTTSTFSSGVSSIVVGAATNIAIGWTITGPGIAAGTVVSSVAGTTIGLSSPTIAAGAGVSLVFKDVNTIIPVGAYITSITDGTHVVLSQAAIASKSGLNIMPGGQIQSGSQLQ